MDMMRPIALDVLNTVPDAPIVTNAALVSNNVNLTWTDPTPVTDPGTPGNPKNEIGFEIQRATVTNGTTGTFAVLGYPLANATTYVDSTVVPGTNYLYRMLAFNAAGDSP